MHSENDEPAIQESSEVPNCVAIQRLLRDVASLEDLLDIHRLENKAGDANRTAGRRLSARLNERQVERN